MHPNIIIGNLIISSWYTMLVIGAIFCVALAVYLRPADFPIKRWELLAISVVVVIASVLGARLLFVILHWNERTFTLADVFSYSGGFAYFGALVLSMLTVWLYALIRGFRFLGLLDYAMPFLMLSQVFVRIGCFMAGCCYGKPTGLPIGVIFKPIDKIPRHPTQIYEAILLVFVFVISRKVYAGKKGLVGYASFFAIMIYGLGRFFIEYLRTDSPLIVLNITLAQIVCLSLAIGSYIICYYISRRQT